MKALIEKLKSVTGRSAAAAARENAQHRVLFVCMGNICRSPTAEGVFRHLLAARAPDLSVHVESAGTHAYHVGEAPDPRAQRAAERRGIDISGLRARKVAIDDFALFDWVIAMDELNRAQLQELCPPEFQGRIRLLLEFAPRLGRLDVPDPYYGGANGFEYVLDLVEEAGAELLEVIRRTDDRRRSAPES